MVIHRDLANKKWDMYGTYTEIASGKQQFAIEHGHRKFVDLPSYNMVMFHSYASLPEGEDHVGVGQNDELHQDGQVHHVEGCCLTHAQSLI